MTAPLLTMQHIVKSFYGVKVLDDVSIDLFAGETLALLGENGAGKSTLIKILNGDYRRDGGEILIDGQPVNIDAPRDAENLGIRMIYQELHYAPELSVAENLLLGALPRRGGALNWLIDWQQMNRQAHEALALLNVDIAPTTKMRDLSVVEREIIEIVKALSRQARIIVMDEPTAALTPPEVQRLFGIIRGLQARGVGIIYISHRLDEVFEIAGRITVLRDGKHVGTNPRAEVTHQSLVQMMVGRSIEDRAEVRAQSEAITPGAVALEVRGLSKAGAFNTIDLQVRAGEIVGLFGLLGAGHTLLTQAIFGAIKSDSGTILVDGTPARIASPQDGQRAGIGFVPLDRKVNGLVLDMSVRKNITLSNWRVLTRFGAFQRGLEMQHSRNWVDQLGIRMAGGIETHTRYLSGGNQQKVVLARWLEANVRVLLLNEPTWGVDVGARSDIYDQLEALAAQGLAILMVSSDIEEVLSVSHRILTIYKGRLTGEFSQSDATQEKLLHAAAGGQS
ncbi:MAG: sugar ABC transporter ATP-binding protein [Anaerolineae bacterium]|nr:sugar ABC transporter ATP-binding protein [Anaerolineae bacterium]NUQ04551.1 sugar ABC transporter ATP-binding protein [Anaerolineae bacterium]